MITPASNMSTIFTTPYFHYFHLLLILTTTTAPTSILYCFQYLPLLPTSTTSFNFFYCFQYYTYFTLPLPTCTVSATSSSTPHTSKSSTFLIMSIVCFCMLPLRIYIRSLSSQVSLTVYEYFVEGSPKYVVF